MQIIVRLDATPGVDDYGVYDGQRNGPFGTPLQFRGTLDEVLAWRDKELNAWKAANEAAEREPESALERYFPELAWNDEELA